MEKGAQSARPLTAFSVDESPIAWGGHRRIYETANLLKRFNAICPVQSHLQKDSISRFAQIKSISPPSRSPEGRFAIVTNVARDAVDADAPLTNGA
jgi:hypothetical protein